MSSTTAVPIIEWNAVVITLFLLDLTLYEYRTHTFVLFCAFFSQVLDMLEQGGNLGQSLEVRDMARSTTHGPFNCTWPVQLHMARSAATRGPFASQHLSYLGRCHAKPSLAGGLTTTLARAGCCNIGTWDAGYPSHPP